MKETKKSREKLVQTLITKLIKAIKNIHQRQNFPFGNYILSRQQIMILFFIREKKSAGVAVKDLAKFLSVTPGAVTQFVDSLVKYKLVVRRAGIKDRRLTKIKLSPSAKTKFQKFQKEYLTSANAAFSSLKYQELQEFIKLIDKIKI